jgi:hypothetical protein
MPSLASLAAAVLAASSLASASKPIILHSADVMARPYAAIANNMLLGRRQDTPAPAINSTGNSDVKLNPDGSINLESWNTVTDAACVEALKQLPRSTNPSGHCVCYNLPSLNADTGEFEADLRLYRVSESRDGFATVRPQDVEIEITFEGAKVETVSEEDVKMAGMQGKVAGLKKRAAGDPELVTVSNLLGKINPDRMSSQLTMAQLEELVIPVLTLTAQNGAGSRVTTSVTLNEASFLTGVFSNEVVLSDFGAAQASVDTSMSRLTSGQVAFVLPGTQILIFPIGLIITSVWLLLGVSAYGYGTFQRMSYAETYRRRTNGSGAPRKTI